MDEIEKTRFAKAISSPLRRKIIEIIAKKPSSVNEITMQTQADQPKVSSNLAILSEARLVDSIQMGREKIYRIAPEKFEDMVDWLDSILHSKSSGGSANYGLSPVNDLNYARTCYDHLAGEMGVYLLEELLKRKWIILDDPEKPTYRLTTAGAEELTVRGVSVPPRANGKRMFAYGCKDWTVKRFHLGGFLGSSILKVLEARGYVERIEGSRILKVKIELSKFFG